MTDPLIISALKLARKARIDGNRAEVPVEEMLQLRQLVINEIIRLLVAFGWSETMHEKNRVAVYTKGKRDVWVPLDPKFADWGLRVTEVLQELFR